ncbi:MAG: hypothetical protein HQM02_12365, partial [Magnetococcales bacterium]|nr:hypothetical protein [Magnetococcales bacterium]
SDPLVPLLSTLEAVDRVVGVSAVGDDPWHDFWTLPLSIPWRVATTLDTIPAALPYLTPLPERLSEWEGRLSCLPGVRVGLVWKGNPGFIHDATRSLPGLELLASWWSLPGISFVSLQKGAGEEEADPPPAGQPLLHLGGGLRDFADTAAIVRHLDLVICVDSAIAHLAGALGKACWVLLPWHEDWRWLRERGDSPWYPGVMRLFRQPEPDAWPEVVRQVGAALARFTPS